MKEFIEKWSNWWVLAPKRKQLNDAFEKELNEIIEREVSIRMGDNAEQGEQCCKPACGFYLGTICPKCNKHFRENIK